MPLWLWIVIGLAVVGAILFVASIWAYPRDNSF